MALWNGIKCLWGPKTKKASVTALSCLLTAGMYWARVTGQRGKGHWDNCSCASYFRVAPKLFSGSLKKTVQKPIKASNLRKQGMSSEERGRIETVLCWVSSSKTNQGSSSFCLLDWKRQDITYWWALVVQGETHASFKEIPSYSFQAASSDT